MINVQHPEFAGRAGQFSNPVANLVLLENLGNFVECRFYVVKDEGGVLCAKAENLPGVFTYGNTYEEVDERMREAFELTLETYAEDGEQPPWQEMHEAIPVGSVRRRVLIDRCQNLAA